MEDSDDKTIRAYLGPLGRAPSIPFNHAYERNQKIISNKGDYTMRDGFMPMFIGYGLIWCALIALLMVIDKPWRAPQCAPGSDDMSKRLSATESLARDICWGGFVLPRQGTKAAYWKSLPEETRRRYCEQASEYIWWTRKLGAGRLEAAVLQHDDTR